MTARAELEAAILAAPDAREGYAVYADWLLERGDADGELIAVQLALEDRPGDPALQARERELVTEQERQLQRLYYHVVGQAIRDPIWRRGLLHAIAIVGDAYSNDNAYAYRELIADPIARFLRELAVRPVTLIGGRPTPGDGDLVEAIAATGAPAALRRLSFTPFDFQISWTRLTDLSPTYSHLPRLEELSITAGDVTLGRVELPALRSLEIVTGGLRRHVLESVAAASWPRLERLVLYLGTERYGGECTIADLSPILDGAVLPAGVTTLGLCNSELGDELVEAVACSRVLPRLRRLDLSEGTIGDAGARLLLDRADAFGHLAELDLGGNYLTAEVSARLARLGPRVETAGQRLPEHGHRYVAIGE